jgi:hypothetical protein
LKTFGNLLGFFLLIFKKNIKLVKVTNKLIKKG